MPYVRNPVDTRHLADLAAIQAAAEVNVTKEVVRLRLAGASWQDLADALGGPRQNVQRKYQNLDGTSYTYRVQRTGFGWIVSVVGVPAAVFHYQRHDPPGIAWVKTELAAVLGRSEKNFELRQVD